jgi:hypothetical protein
MVNLSSALQELRAERKQAQLQVEKLDQAISVIESLNGSATTQNADQPTRIISAASRRKMAQAQKGKMGKGSWGIAANCDSENNGLGSRKAHHVSGSPQEDCSISESAVGENKGAAKEGCVDGCKSHS